MKQRRIGVFCATVTVISLIIVALYIAEVQKSSSAASDYEEETTPSYQEQIYTIDYSKESLRERSTGELLKLALSYPKKIDVFAFDRCEQGFEHLIRSCSIYSVLMEREDMVDTIIGDYDVLSTLFFEPPEASSSIVNRMFFDAFIQYILNTSSLSDTQKAALQDMIATSDTNRLLRF